MVSASTCTRVAGRYQPVLIGALLLATVGAIAVVHLFAERAATTGPEATGAIG